MKNISLIICLVLFTISPLAKAQEDADQETNGKTIKVMTYNLRYASGTFKPPWKIRRDMQVDLFNKYSPDIIGTQEGVKEQIDYLMELQGMPLPKSKEKADMTSRYLDKTFELLGLGADGGVQKTLERHKRCVRKCFGRFVKAAGRDN